MRTLGDLQMMMSSRGVFALTRPDPLPGHLIGILISSDEVKVYGNRAGLLTLARQLVWIARAAPEENYELHTALHLRPDALKNDVVVFAKDDSVPCINIEPEIAPDGQSGTFGFELTFMHLSEQQMDSFIEAAGSVNSTKNGPA